MKLNIRFLLIAALALVGCGDDAPALGTVDSNPVNNVDAASVDASTHQPDAVTTADAALVTGVVQVVVYDSNGALAVGVPVAFLNADDSVVLETTTGDDGTASATMQSGGTVVALNNTFVTLDGQPDVYTFLDVQAGDVLTAGTPAQATFGASLTLSFPPASAGHIYSVSSSCGQEANLEQTSLTYLFTSGCTSADFYILAEDCSGAPIGVLYVPGQAISDGATVALTGDFTAMTDFDFTIANLPSAVTSNASTGLIDNGVLIEGPDGFVDTTNGNTTSYLVAQFAGLDAVWDTSVAQVSGSILEVQGRQATADHVTVDYATDALPEIDALPEVTSNLISWTEASVGTAESSAVDLAATDAPYNFTIHITGPHNDSTLRIPTFPASIGTFDANLTLTASNVTIFQTPGGWNDERQNVFSRDRSNAALVLPSNGGVAKYSSNAGPIGGFHVNQRAVHHVAAAPHNLIHPCD